MSREKTTEEIRQEFINHIKWLASYWEKQPSTTKEKLDGLAFSILVALDGCSELPGFIVAPAPHESDKQFAIDNGGDYYPQNHEIGNLIKGDISGGLHDMYK